MISKQGFTRSNLPDQIRNKTAIRMQMTKQQPFLEAQNFHQKLHILVEAIIGCNTSSDICRRHNNLQCDHRAYHHIAAFNGVIKPQQDGHLHWHIMLYSSVLSPELLEKTAAALSMTLQTQAAKMLESITCTTILHEIHQWYNDILASIQHSSKHPRGAGVEVPNASSNFDYFISLVMKKTLLIGMHGHGFCCEKGNKGKYMCHLVFKQGLHKLNTCPHLIILFKLENIAKKPRVDV